MEGSEEEGPEEETFEVEAIVKSRKRKTQAIASTFDCFAILHRPPTVFVACCHSLFFTSRCVCFGRRSPSTL